MPRFYRRASPNSFGRGFFHLEAEAGIVEDCLQGQEAKTPAVCSQEELEQHRRCMATASSSPKSKEGSTEYAAAGHYFQKLAKYVLFEI